MKQKRIKKKEEQNLSEKMRCGSKTSSTIWIWGKNANNKKFM